jgi:uncharacterized protein DUF3429
VASTDNGAGVAHPDPAADWAGYLLTAPLVVSLAGVGLLPSYAQQELAQRVAIAWGAVLLASAGAVHWGLALAGRLPWTGGRRAAAVTPALVAAFGAVIGGQHGLALLAVGFGLFWLYERRSLEAQLPAAYLSLRRHLTLANSLLLAVTMLVSDAAGLS